jgi:uncharacterized protein YfeS
MKPNPIVNLLTSPFLYLLRLTSPEIKRMIFLSSLFSLFKHTYQEDSPTLQRLNEMFKLSCRSDALQLPMYLHEVIWRCDDLPTDSRVVLQKAPSWLNYGSAERMREDIEQVIAQLPVFA